MLALPGIALLLLLAADVFLTVFHAQGHAGLLTRWQNRAVWETFRWAGRRGEGSARDRLLGFGAPVMVVLTLAIWMTLLVVGFALVYLPWIDTFLFSPGALRSPWVEALYFSGYTAATLGLGDVVPDVEWLRLVAPAEAAAGFALISVSITYLLAVYRELVAMRALGSRVATFAEAVGSVRERETGSEVDDAAERWAEDLAARLAHVLQAHFQYPILHYFRPLDRDQALLVQLGWILDWTEVRATPWRAPAAGARADELPLSLRVLRSGVERYLRTVHEVFVPGEDTPPDRDARALHDDLMRLMVYRT